MATATVSLKKLREQKTLSPVYADRSTIANYASCPFMADVILSGKVKDVSTLAEVGIEGHKILAEAINARGDNYLDIADYLKNELVKARPDIQPQVLASMRGISSLLRQIPIERIIGVEQQYATEFFAPTSDRGAIVLTCCMDLTLAGKDANTIHVHDYKTGWKQWSNSDARDSFQTCFYSWILFKEIPEIEKIHFWYDQTRYGAIATAYACLERERDYYMFEGRIQSAVALWLAGSKVAWPAQEKCAWCAATQICPHAIAAARDFNKNKTKYLQQYIALSARVIDMETTMKEYCKKHGTIRHKDQVFGHKEPQKRITYKLYTDKIEEDGLKA